MSLTEELGGLMDHTGVKEVLMGVALLIQVIVKRQKALPLRR